tara:strand:+ start:15885 stop:16079 length:195 start_codon:yes stop_codon:yes gene_type:complete
LASTDVARSNEGIADGEGGGAGVTDGEEGAGGAAADSVVGSTIADAVETTALEVLLIMTWVEVV